MRDSPESSPRRVGSDSRMGQQPLQQTIAPPIIYSVVNHQRFRSLRQHLGRSHALNIFLWILQLLAALLYGASGVMKVFMFDKIKEQDQSFGALPRQAWAVLGIVELVCVVGLIVPGVLHWRTGLTVVAAAVLAIESLVFIGVHVKYRQLAPILMSVVLGLLMAFVAYGRMVLHPLF